jgi:hypothetical protein
LNLDEQQSPETNRAFYSDILFSSYAGGFTVILGWPYFAAKALDGRIGAF